MIFKILISGRVTRALTGINPFSINSSQICDSKAFKETTKKKIKLSCNSLKAFASLKISKGHFRKTKYNFLRHLGGFLESICLISMFLFILYLYNIFKNRTVSLVLLLLILKLRMNESFP